MATADSTRTTRTPFNPQYALTLLQHLSDQIDEINAVARAAISLENAKTEPDLTILSLFRNILYRSEDASAIFPLRDMLEGYEETLP